MSISAYNGSSWQTVATGDLKVYDGSSWQTVKDVWVYNGVTWSKIYSTTPSITGKDNTTFNTVGSCPTAYVEAVSKCYVDNWNSTDYRLEAWIRHGSSSCSSSYEQVDGDVSVSAGVSQTMSFNLSDAVLSDYAETPGSDGSLYAQYEWRIYARSGGALIDSLADSCRSCTYSYCF
jgi:hypothetical protein